MTDQPSPDIAGPAADSAAQLASPSYRVAALDQDFLLGDSMRGLRFQLEYAKAEEILRAHRIRSTVVVFGSARVREDMSGPQGRWYAQAREFGRICSLRGGALDGLDGERDHVIATGGGPGVMEAANRGAAEAGALTIGFNITLPHEQVPNRFTTPELTFQFHYFAMRKMHLAMRARALVVFPGGFGTFDELFEMLTLVQTGKAPGLPIVLFDRAFWTGAVNFESLVDYGFIHPRDRQLVHIVDDAQEAWTVLARAGLGRSDVDAGTRT